jgi:UDP-N-acetylglucosamine 2-epimerase (non-hydrolysing)
MIKVLTVFGTRPEAIKLAPVIRELERRPDVFESRICVTGQHREMLDQMLDLFGIEPDHDLKVMQQAQSLNHVTVAVIDGLRPILEEEKPDWVLVQGDTTTTMAGALGAFHNGIKVGHVEAGLRTFDKHDPWPEEMNRRVAGVLADVHFAPTPASAQNLYREGVSKDRVYVTGNTVIDALRSVAELPFDPGGTPLARLGLNGKRLIVATMHRRELTAEALAELCSGLRAVAEHHPEVQIVIPVHRNPKVRGPVHAALGDVANIDLLDPLDYQPMLWLVRRSHFVITDSGGLQEEVTALGKPVIVIRSTTERPESVEAGNAVLVGTDGAALESWAHSLLGDEQTYQAMARSTNPYGSGDAAKKIVDILESRSLGPDRGGGAGSGAGPGGPARIDPEVVRWGADGLARWISSGACQSASGAFAAWVELASGEKAYDYAEITGYGLTHLAARRELAEEEIQVGRRAAEWLAARVQQRRLAARDGWDGDAVYLFDLGMISTGLQTFGGRVGEQRYVDAGLELVGLLERELAVELGPVSANGPSSERTNWSTRGIVHLAKLAQCLLLAGREEPAGRLIEAARSTQGPDGHMPTDPESAVTMLHPHMYGAEGLWMWGQATGDQDAIDRARAAVQWVWTHQLGSGGLPRAVGRPEPIEQLDVTSQAVRMALLLGVHTPAVDRAIERLLEVARERDGMLALPYQPASPDVHLNTWVTMFGSQALGLAAPGAEPLRWDQLV